MPIKPGSEKEWADVVERNSKDGYSKCCVDVAKKLMEILDKGVSGPLDTHALVCQADDESGAGGITGFMAGAVASMVSQFHTRGDEFKRAWNKSHGIDDENAKGVVNPAIITVG